MDVVADSSPICYLSILRAEHILPRLYGQVFIPHAVLAELQHAKAPQEVRTLVAHPPAWLRIEDPQQVVRIEQLHSGEEAALRLAFERQAILLIDERAGRDLASTPPWNLKVLGTVGVLEQAACRNLIDLKDALTRLTATRFHVHRQLIEDALRRDAGRKLRGQ